MDTAEERKRKRTAAGITIGFHVLALILFFIFGLTQPDPLPEDAGASIEFGWDAAAGGDAVADIADTPANTTPSNPEPTPEETVTETPSDEVTAQDESEIAVPTKPAVKPKKPVEKPTEKPAEKPAVPVEEPKPTLSNKLSDALNNINQSGGGGSQGNTTGTGDEGNPNGTTGRGALGGGSGSWQLDGRSMMPGFGTKIKDTKEEGVLVMKIVVDRNGRVVKADPDLGLSTTTSQYLVNLATKDLLENFRFNGDPAAQVEQRGKVRYVFQLK